MRVQWLNRAACESVSLSREELIGRHCYEIWHQRSNPCENCPIAKAMKTGRKHENEIISPDGRIWHIRGYPVFNEIDEIIGAVEITREITDRKKAERALRESEENYKNLYNTALVGLWRTRIEDGVYLRANSVMVKTLGFTHESELVSNRSMFDFYTQNDRQDLLNTLERDGEVCGYETRLNLPDESQIDISLSARVFQEKGYIEGAAIDITDRKKIENLLRKSEKKYRNLVENLSEGVVITDFQENLLFVNSAACNMLGYRRDELMGMNFSELVSDDYRSRIKRETAERKKGIHSKYEVKINRKDGEARHLIISASPQIDDSGRIEGSIGIMTDVTQSRQSDQERKKLQEQLEKAQRMESLGVLAGGVAHDLNNILGPLVAYPEMILGKLPLDSPARKQIMMMGKAAVEASGVIQDLLSLARRGRYEMEPVNINNVVKSYISSASMVETTERNPGVEVEEILDTNIGNILGSAPHLQKVFMNLVINAFDAMPNGGKLKVKTSRTFLDRLRCGYTNIAKGEYVMLEVIDTGIGIDEKCLKHIFEPYYSKKKMGHSGSGLGLSVVYSILKDHRGYYDIFSRVGEGTEFVLYFPVYEGKETEKYCVIGNYEGREKILVVDDVKDQRAIATELLASLGYKVSSASNGRKALDFLAENAVDIVILDMIMEDDFDGLDTYREILKLNPHQKAIIVSGYSATHRVNQAIKLGVGKYIKKPYTLNTLGKAVREELDRIS